MNREFRSFSEFYPYYLSEHSNRTCRRLHFVGTLGLLGVALIAVLTGRLSFLWLMPVVGYGCAWIGHFFFERNKPATFKHPFYSLVGDFVMFRDMLTGRIPI